MRERVKSAVLVLLLVLAVALSYVSLTLGVRGAAMPAALLRLLHGTEPAAQPAEETFSAAAAARPEKLAVLTTAGVYQADGVERYDAMWTAVAPFFEEAMGSGDTPQSVTEQGFSAALCAPAVLLCYDTALPYSLLRVWSDAAADESALTVRSVLLCAGETGVSLLFRDGDGACWRMETAASVHALLELCGGSYGDNAFLAGTEERCRALLPEEPVLRARPELPVLSLAPTAAAEEGELPRAVLTAFSLNPYLAKVYQDSAGGTVYVEGHSTLRVTAAGDLLYAAGDGGIPVALPAGENAVMRAARMCDAVYALLNTVWSELGAGGTLSLDSLSTDESTGAWTLRFELERGGRFLDLGDRCWAQAVLRGDAITDVQLCPRRLTEGETQTLLPLRQAAAALEGSGAWRLSVRWLPDGADGLRPAVCKEN